MTVDNTKLSFNSTWNIDLLVATGTASIGTGASAIYAIPAGLPAIPVYEIQLKPAGSTAWFQAGGYSQNGTLASVSFFYTYVASGVIYINTLVGGVARYFVWSDKVNY